MGSRILRNRARKRKQRADVTKRLFSFMGGSVAFFPLIPAGFSSQEASAVEQVTQDMIEPEVFIDAIAASAQQVAHENDLYSSVMIAQALLESSYGNSQLSAAPYYNLFGVKGSAEEQSVSFVTDEYIDENWVSTTEPFRVYDSYTAAFQDHANVLTHTLRADGSYQYEEAWKSRTTDYTQATAALTGRYATDPAYAEKLNWLIAAYQLTDYDEISEVSYDLTFDTASGAFSTYTVVSGDTLWDIATRFGTSVDQLMANNGLTSDLILIGQVLVV